MAGNSVLIILYIRKVNRKAEVTCLDDTVRAGAGNSDSGLCDCLFQHPISSRKGKVHKKPTQLLHHTVPENQEKHVA